MTDDMPEALDATIAYAVADADAHADARLDAAEHPPQTRLPRTDDGQPYLEDDDQADWALRRLGQLRAAMARVDRMASERTARIEAWRGDELRRLAEPAGLLEGMLTGWHRRRLDADPRPWKDKAGKTVRLPSGELRARAGRPRLVVDDEATLVGWLEARYPGLVKVVKRPDVASMKAATVGEDAKGADTELLHTADGAVVYLPDGEVVPGVRWDDGQPSYTVEAGG